jgi:hypothetical protein
VSEEAVQALAAQNVLLRMTDEIAFKLLYKEQYDSTLLLDDFDHDFNNMCIVMAHSKLREGIYMLMSMREELEEGWDKPYIEVIRPVFSEYESIIRNYKENLCFLSPAKPDGPNVIHQSFLWLMHEMQLQMNYQLSF